jgi:hypothetical protein
MAEEITYYAIASDSGAITPRGVVRRVRDQGGERDEVFGRDLNWSHTTLLYAAERGDTMNEFYEISEDEAMRIVERIRRDTAT